MDGPDETIHQPVRLRIMAALTALPPADEGLDFARLKSLTGATDGNLGAHIDHLARVPATSRSPRLSSRAGRAPRSRRAALGRAAFARHVAFLREIIAGA